MVIVYRVFPKDKHTRREAQQFVHRMFSGGKLACGEAQHVVYRNVICVEHKRDTIRPNCLYRVGPVVTTP